MKKKLFCITLTICTLFFFPAGAKAQEQQNSMNGSLPVSSAAEDQEAPNIAFVQQLQMKLEKDDLDGALALYDTMPEALKGDSSLQGLHASLLLSAGRNEEAGAIGKNLLTENAGDKDILELNAQIATASGDKQLQKDVVNRLLALDPYNATANIILGNQQALRKKYKLAFNYYKKALVSEPHNIDALFGYAQMAYYLNDLKTSKEKFQLILDISPENAAANSYMGKLAAEEENYLSATKYIRKAIEADSTNYDFYIDLGQYMRSQGKFDEAEKAWTKAIELDPGYFLAYTYRAGLYDEQNRFAEALADYHKITETNPKYYFAYEEIGILEFHEGNWAGSRKAFTTANSVSKSTAYQLMIIATYLKEKNLPEAKKYAQGCMKNIKRESIDYQMIRLYHDQGGINAENAVAKAIDKENSKNTRGKMTYYLALYYELKGLPQIAEEYYSKVTKIQTPMFFEYRLAEWGLKK